MGMNPEPIVAADHAPRMSLRSARSRPGAGAARSIRATLRHRARAVRRHGQAVASVMRGKSISVSATLLK